jgi:hypothetical protein
MMRNRKHPREYMVSAAAGALPPGEDTYAEELYRYYAGIPGWRGRDRNVLATSPPNSAGLHEIERINARAAAHEEVQIRSADAAVVRDAREGRMPG